MRVGEEALADHAGVSMWGSTGWEGKHTTCTESWTLARQVLPALASFVAVASARIKKTRFFGIVCTEHRAQSGGGEVSGQESCLRGKGRRLSAGWRCSARPLSASRCPARDKMITQQSPNNRIASKIPRDRCLDDPHKEKRKDSLSPD